MRKDESYKLQRLASFPEHASCIAWLSTTALKNKTFFSHDKVSHAVCKSTGASSLHPGKKTKIVSYVPDDVTGNLKLTNNDYTSLSGVSRPTCKNSESEKYIQMA